MPLCELPSEATLSGCLCPAEWHMGWRWTLVRRPQQRPQCLALLARCQCCERHSAGLGVHHLAGAEDRHPSCSPPAHDKEWPADVHVCGLARVRLYMYEDAAFGARALCWWTGPPYGSLPGFVCKMQFVCWLDECCQLLTQPVYVSQTHVAWLGNHCNHSGASERWFILGCALFAPAPPQCVVVCRAHRATPHYPCH